MGKTKKAQIVHLDSLIHQCGYHFNGGINGGHSCSHPKVKDNEGLCFSFSCPLAVEASLADIRRHDRQLYRSCRENADAADVKQAGGEDGYCPASQTGEDWMLWDGDSAGRALLKKQRRITQLLTARERQCVLGLAASHRKPQLATKKDGAILLWQDDLDDPTIQCYSVIRPMRRNKK